MLSNVTESNPGKDRTGSPIPQRGRLKRSGVVAVEKIGKKEGGKRRGDKERYDNSRERMSGFRDLVRRTTLI